jgi:hypothetical protein
MWERLPCRDLPLPRHRRVAGPATALLTANFQQKRFDPLTFPVRFATLITRAVSLFAQQGTVRHERAVVVCADVCRIGRVGGDVCGAVCCVL